MENPSLPTIPKMKAPHKIYKLYKQANYADRVLLDFYGSKEYRSLSKDVYIPIAASQLMLQFLQEKMRLKDTKGKEIIQMMTIFVRLVKDHYTKDEKPQRKDGSPLHKDDLVEYYKKSLILDLNVIYKINNL